eukprot:2863475-Amphidinium_carterae.1
MEAGDNEFHIYDLSEYMTHIQGDTEEDDIRLRQLQDLEDDRQSIVDKDYYDRVERGERDAMDE